MIKRLRNNKYFNAEPKYKVFTEALKVSHVPYTTKYNELYNPILVAMQNALQEKVSSKEAFSTAVDKMNNIINK